MMMEMILEYYQKSAAALEQGADIEKLAALPVRENIGRFKYTEESETDLVYRDIRRMLEEQIQETLGGREEV